MATYSTLSIANHSLLLLGASPITALTDDTANARAMNEVFENCVKGFLTECRWTFSTTRTTLVTNSTTGLFPWQFQEEGYIYDRPGDTTNPTNACLRIWDMSDPQARWREEGEYIISDTASLGARWTWYNTEYHLWRPKAITAFMDKLCSDVAYMIINSATKGEYYLKKYQEISLPAAMTENSQTGFQQEPLDGEWLSSKYSDGIDASRSYS